MPEKQYAPLYGVEIGIVVPALICLPIWLSDERGFLRDERLTVRLRSLRTTEVRHTVRYTELSPKPFRDFWRD
jgi:hypothetical protein